jgi:uncharacterized membrane protein
MSELIAIVYPGLSRAREVLESMQRLEQAHLVDLQDACWVTKDDRGRVELHQTVNVTARGAVGGAFWGSLIGLVFLNPLVGMAAGAAAGAVGGALTDYGISDPFMRGLGATMAPGSSAVFFLARRLTFDKVEPELAKFGGRVLHTSLSSQVEARLQVALDAAGRTPLADGAGRAPSSSQRP